MKTKAESIRGLRGEHQANQRIQESLSSGHQPINIKREQTNGLFFPVSLSLLISCQFVSIYLSFSVLFSAFITQSTCPPRSQLHTYRTVCELQSLTQQTHITKSPCLTSSHSSSSARASPPACLSAVRFCIIYFGPRCICFLYSFLSSLHLLSSL